MVTEKDIRTIYIILAFYNVLYIVIRADGISENGGCHTRIRYKPKQFKSVR